VVVTSYWKRPEILLNSGEHVDELRKASPAPEPDVRTSDSVRRNCDPGFTKGEEGELHRYLGGKKNFDNICSI